MGSEYFRNGRKKVTSLKQNIDIYNNVKDLAIFIFWAYTKYIKKIISFQNNKVIKLKIFSIR